MMLICCFSQTIKTLSEQQWLDCVYESLQAKDGCQGGWPENCYIWTKNNNNMIAADSDYRYKAKGMEYFFSRGITTK